MRLLLILLTLFLAPGFTACGQAKSIKTKQHYSMLQANALPVEGSFVETGTLDRSDDHPELYLFYGESGRVFGWVDTNDSLSAQGFDLGGAVRLVAVDSSDTPTLCTDTPAACAPVGSWGVIHWVQPVTLDWL